ncbi:hypothetical protein KSP40_PGU007150 [Platanthera guangdongensis]|uniref:Uncharacterized protein n=1 Tax=Platanthera guangdongensis TaxID=2320717 RepID=A0ABR2LYP2_9ASPA
MGFQYNKGDFVGATWPIFVNRPPYEPQTENPAGPVQVRKLHHPRTDQESGNRAGRPKPLADPNEFLISLGEELWDNGRACGSVYDVTCIFESGNQCVAQEGGSLTARARVVDYCKDCRGDVAMLLSLQAFASIANIDAVSKKKCENFCREGYQRDPPPAEDTPRRRNAYSVLLRKLHTHGETATASVG